MNFADSLTFSVKQYQKAFRSDEAALADFEQLVLSQKPAEKPWVPVTPFDFESRKQIEGCHPALIWQHLIGEHATDVLDYGCGPDGHLVRLLRAARPESTVSITGYDPQADESQLGLRRQEPRRAGAYDLVACREVCEHCTIREVVRIVRKLCDLSAGLIYLTTRFAKAPDHFLSVDTADDLDPDHRTMLTQPMLRLLFVLEGFRRRADLEERMDHKNLGRCLVYERIA